MRTIAATEKLCPPIPVASRYWISARNCLEMVFEENTQAHYELTRD
jgi:hypothetical protein